MYIDTNVSFADLKQTLLYFSKEMIGEEIKEGRKSKKYVEINEEEYFTGVFCVHHFAHFEIFRINVRLKLKQHIFSLLFRNPGRFFLIPSSTYAFLRPTR